MLNKKKIYINWRTENFIGILLNRFYFCFFGQFALNYGLYIATTSSLSKSPPLSLTAAVVVEIRNSLNVFFFILSPRPHRVLNNTVSTLTVCGWWRLGGGGDFGWDWVNWWRLLAECVTPMQSNPPKPINNRTECSIAEGVPLASDHRQYRHNVASIWMSAKTDMRNTTRICYQ